MMIESTEYPKIESPFMRFTTGDLRNQLDRTRWSRPEFEELQFLRWEFTEKVDGMNTRVFWDGHKPWFGGRTDKAQMPIVLLDELRRMFSEELLEEQFGSTGAVLYGEGYGPGINNGGDYADKPGFVLFDVFVSDPMHPLGGWWLLRDNVVAVSQGLGIEVVPVRLNGTVQTAIDLVASGMRSAWDSKKFFVAEGLVGRAPMGLLDRSGKRIMMKIKTRDFAPMKKGA